MGRYTLTRSDGCLVTGNITDGKVDGEVVVAWPSGQLRSVRMFAANVPIGTHTEYDENGEIVETLRYEDGVAVELNGQPLTWGDDGQL